MAWGTLYVVATPLGHLGDLSRRAAEVLATVPLVAAEDTRRTRQLLSHLGARPRLVSFHAHSAPGRRDDLIATLQAGTDVALVSDAGTPTVSDPGADLVGRVLAAGGPVVPIPGPSAVTAVLSAAGLPADRYLFLGFLPRRGGERRRLLATAAASQWTVVLFEAPTRLVALLTDLSGEAGPDRRAVVAREVTKVHEEFTVGTLGELAARWADETPRGEVTIVVEGRPAPADMADPDQTVARAAELLGEGATASEVARMIAAEFGLSRNAAYRLVQEVK